MKVLNFLFAVCVAGTFGAVIWMPVGFLVGGKDGALAAMAFSALSLIGLLAFVVVDGGGNKGKSSGYEAPDYRD